MKFPLRFKNFVEAALVVCAYLAVVEESAIASNVIYFSVGLSALLATPFILAPKDLVRKSSLSFPAASKFSYLCDSLVLTTLVAGGWWWCLAGQTWQLFIRAYIDELRKEAIHAAPARDTRQLP